LIFLTQPSGDNMTTAHGFRASALLIASLFALSSHAVSAQTAAKKPVAKPVTSKPSTKSTSTPVSAAAAVPAAAAMTLSPEQLGIAQIVHTGRVVCADGHSVTVTPDTKVQGAFDLHFGKVKYIVTPKPTSTGAVRLEDPRSGIVFMQLANKSMLFNEKLSRRLADDCISPAQQAVADQMRTNPTPGVLDSASR
jgi:hypothetical protein